jgi:hypothetical protein
MQDKRVVLFVLSLIIVVAIVYTWATWQYFTIPVPGGNDFLAHYSVWDLYIKEGVNPYSDEAALHTQMLIRGRPAEIGEDQNRLTYPFYSLLMHAPFTFIEYPLARAIYMTLLQGAVVLSVILTIRLLNWKLPIWMAGLLLSWSILHYPESRGIILGQFAAIGFLSFIGALYLFHRKSDMLAGVVLVISTMKPTLVFLLIPFLLLWAIVQRRRKFLLGFFGMLGGLVAGSFVLLPSWISDWFVRIFAYSEYTVGQSPIWLLSHEYLPWLGSLGEVLLTAVLVMSVFFLWWDFFRRSVQDSFYWIIGITLLVSNLIVPRSATTNYVMLLLPILGLFAAIDRRIRAGRALILIVMTVSLIGHWYLHYATVVGNQEQPILFLPIPIAVALGLFLGRSILLEDMAKAGMTL